jgi:hypothetical protein
LIGASIWAFAGVDVRSEIFFGSTYPIATARIVELISSICDLEEILALFGNWLVGDFLDHLDFVYATAGPEFARPYIVRGHTAAEVQYRS